MSNNSTQQTIYQQKGFADRRAYLLALAEENGLKPEMVFQAAQLLGQNEDFDGLLSMLNDFKMQMGIVSF